MKKNTHPKYQEVLFVDSSTGFKFVCGSCVKTDKKETYEGKEYPAYHVSVSSASHPFFTGKTGLIDAEGRVEKFRKRYVAASEKLKETTVVVEPQKPAKKRAKV